MKSPQNLSISTIAWLRGIVTLVSRRGKLRLFDAAKKSVKLVTVVHICNPSPPESGAGRSLFLGQLELYNETPISKRPGKTGWGDDSVVKVLDASV